MLTIHQDLDIEMVDRLEAASAEDADILRECLGISASLRFWHASTVQTQSIIVDQLFEVAHTALPSLPDRKGRANQAGLTTDFTVVEVVAPLNGTSSDPLSEAFDRGLNHIREFQRAYYVVERTPLTLVTRERLPPIIPFGVRRISADKDEWPEALSLFNVNLNVSPLERGELLSRPRLDKVQQALEAQPGHRAFAAFLDMWRRAHVSFEREGDYQACAIYAAVGAELLLDDLLAHLIWEEGVRPEDASDIFSGGLATRVRTQFHVRLGGSGWGADRDSAIAGWDQDVASLRNRVVHAAYRPSIDEARVALSSLQALQDFLVSRLTSLDVLAKYPRTAILFVGRDMLQERERWTARLKSLQDDPEEPHWVSTFARWKSVMQRTLRGESPDELKAEEAVLVAVIHPGGNVVWVLHARSAGMARQAEPPKSLSTGQRTSLDQFIREHGGDTTAPISIAMHGARGTPAETSRWVHEYRLIPLAGVMVDRSDFSSPMTE